MFIVIYDEDLEARERELIEERKSVNG